MCEMCCKYGIWLGVPGESEHVHFKVIPSRRGPLATSKQIAGRPENWKTEIRTPQYARRQDRTLQNGTEWQEDKTCNAAAQPCAHKGPADDGKRLGLSESALDVAYRGRQPKQ